MAIFSPAAAILLPFLWSAGLRPGPFEASRLLGALRCQVIVTQTRKERMQSTTYVSNLSGIDEFGPVLRQEALRRGLGQALQLVLLINGAEGLARMGRLCFSKAIQIVDFYHALEHGGKVLAPLWSSKENRAQKSSSHCPAFTATVVPLSSRNNGSRTTPPATDPNLYRLNRRNLSCAHLNLGAGTKLENGST